MKNLTLKFDGLSLKFQDLSINSGDLSLKMAILSLKHVSVASLLIEPAAIASRHLQQKRDMQRSEMAPI